MRRFFYEQASLPDTKEEYPMPDQSQIPPADASEPFVASLRQRSVPANTIKLYAHDVHLFMQVALTICLL